MAEDQLPDELSIEQANQLQKDDLPEELSLTQMEAIHRTKGGQIQMPDELSLEDVQRLQSRSQLAGEASAKLAQGIGDQVSYGDAFNMLDARREFLDRDHGWFQNTLYHLSMPGQMLARQVTGVMAQMGTMDQTTAKDLLSRDSLAFSDMINYYWKGPQSYGGKAARFALGLAADIILDPLNMIELPLSVAGKVASIAGKTVTGLEKMTVGQRSLFKTLEGIEKVVSVDGKILHAEDAMKAESVVKDNLNVLAQVRDGALGPGDLKMALQLSAEGKGDINSLLVNGLRERSAIRELGLGDRALTVGLRVPFTNAALEFKMPGPISLGLGQAGTAVLDAPGKAIQAVSNSRALAALDNMFDLGQKFAQANGVGTRVYRTFQGLFTRTGYSIFDEGLLKRFNHIDTAKDVMGKFGEQANAALANVKARVGDEQFGKVFEDVVNELEMGIHTPEQAFDLAKKRGLKPFEAGELEMDGKALYDWKERNPSIGVHDSPFLKKKLHELDDLVYNARGTPGEAAARIEREKFLLKTGMRGEFDFEYTPLKVNPLIERLYTPTAADTARMARLAEHPELVGMIEDMRSALRGTVEEYRKRKLPFEELNPFGEGWARQYLKHTYSREYLDHFEAMKLADDQFGAALRQAAEKLGAVDTSSAGREYRGTIFAANEKTMAEHGVRMYVDNPVQLVQQRVMEMQDVIAKHDMIKSAMPYAIEGRDPGFGWIKMNPEHFRSMQQDVKVGETTFKNLQFLPEELRTQIQAGKSVYFPVDIYDRLIYNTNRAAPGKDLVHTMAAMNTATWFWRNGLLANTGYIGQNMFSNIFTYFGVMRESNPKPVIDAVRALVVPDSLKAIKGESTVVGNMFDMGIHGTWTQEKLFEEAVKHGVLKTGANLMMEADDVLDLAASSYAQKGLTGRDIVNHVYTFSAFRALAQYGDDIPKLATFMSRARQGFTLEKAAEVADRYFYNYRNLTVEQSAIRNAVPFITFPWKSAELVADQIKTGRLNELVIPTHVQHLLEGAYIEDRETRDYMAQILPSYRSWNEPLQGGLLPGLRSMQVDLPWAMASVNALWNVDKAQHPVIQLMLAAASVKNDESELNDPTDVKGFYKTASGFLDLGIPNYVREGLTLLEVNGAADFGGYFVDRYRTQVPDMNQMANQAKLFEDVSPSVNDIQRSAVATRFQNASDFGRYMDKSYGDSWLYNLIFNGSLQGKPDSIYGMAQAGIRGEYMRQRMRNLSLGLATINRGDTTFYSKYFAVVREAADKKRQLLNQLQNEVGLVDPDSALKVDALEQMAKHRPLAKKVLALEDQKAALATWYEWSLMAEKKYPDFSLPKILLGIDKTEMSFDGKPAYQYKQLFPKTAQERYTDEEADTGAAMMYMKKLEGK